MSSRWSLAVPPLAALSMVIAMRWPVSAGLMIVCAIALIGAVLAAVHHAEVVAHRVGEPFDAGPAPASRRSGFADRVDDAAGAENATLPRDTMFAAVMIIGNGLLGASVLLGALRHREQSFRIEGSGPGPAALVTLVTLVLVMPAFTVSAEDRATRPRSSRSWP